MARHREDPSWSSLSALKQRAEISSRWKNISRRYC
ncbi:unnamed protein product [Cyprideis torosa]|uniref:Uncharacterized protein n=1 Tax=Cyprideis torosa TaxID=163714 RepID=A0A7R9A027_9CRUS|nr:unnamed protein product [Cyprideis torosa]CAG0910565.1 unnamed protein product [Cyprideis torosa]